MNSNGYRTFPKNDIKNRRKILVGKKQFHKNEIFKKDKKIFNAKLITNHKIEEEAKIVRKKGKEMLINSYRKIKIK